MSDVEAAAERLAQLRDSDLFTSDPDGNILAARSEGVGVPWSIWRHIKVAVREFLADRAARQALERDAARYRWLRDEFQACTLIDWQGTTFCVDEPSELDAAIDAAIQETDAG